MSDYDRLADLLGLKNPTGAAIIKAAADRIALLTKAADAADAMLCDQEGPQTPAQAHLALALHECGGAYEITGKEQCPCDDRDGCEECAPRDVAIVAIRKLAARSAP